MGTVCSSSEAPAVESISSPSEKTAPPEEETAPPEEETTPPDDQPKATGDKATIKVFGCRGLRNADWSFGGKDASDAYVICKRKPVGAGDANGAKELFTTKTIRNSLEPIFDEDFEVVITPDTSLEFSVYDHDFLGRAELKCADLAKGFNGELELLDAGENIKAYIKVLVKMEGSDYPAGPPPEFKITIKKGEKDLGIKFDKEAADAIFVLSIGSDGPVKEYNDTVGPHQQMKAGQYIVAVNDVKDSSKSMAEEITKAGNLVLSMVRPQCFTVAVNKKGPLGMTLSQSSTANIIKAIQAGHVKEWNGRYPEKEVKVGDRILAVNGDRTSLGKDQMNLLKKDGTMQIVFSRRSPPSEQSEAEHGVWDWF